MGGDLISVGSNGILEMWPLMGTLAFFVSSAQRQGHAENMEILPFERRNNPWITIFILSSDYKEDMDLKVRAHVLQTFSSP